MKFQFQFQRQETQGQERKDEDIQNEKDPQGNSLQSDRQAQVAGEKGKASPRTESGHAELGPLL